MNGNVHIYMRIHISAKLSSLYVRKEMVAMCKKKLSNDNGTIFEVHDMFSE